MKTLKKTLCLVLAVVMVVGVLILPAHAADATTVDAAATAAFNTLLDYGVMVGVDSKNTPALDKNINRQDMAAIIYRVMTGDTTNKYVGNYVGLAEKFADSATFATWAKGYIGFVREREIFMGDENGNFKPTEEIKGCDVLTVLLRCIGYGKEDEFKGANYAQAAQICAASVNLFGGPVGYLDVTKDMNKTISRGVVAKLVYNAVQVPMVTYLNGNYSSYQSNGLPVASNTPGAKKNPSLIGYLPNAELLTHTQYGIEAQRINPTATFNAPLNAVTKYLPTEVLYEAPVKEYWTAVTHCQVAQDLGFTSTLKIDTVYTNGAKNTTSVTLDATNTQAQIGAQGRHTLFFDRNPYDSRPADTIVYIDTLLAKVQSVTPASFDAAGHLKTPATISLRVFDGSTVNGYTDVTKMNGATNYAYTAGQYLLVNAVHKSDASGLFSAKEVFQYGALGYSDENGRICIDQKTDKNLNAGYTSVGSGYLVDILGVASSISGAQSKVWVNVDVDKHTITGTDYNDNNRFHLDEAKNDTNGSYTWFFDEKGNLIGDVKNATAHSYGVITSMWSSVNAADGSSKVLANVTYMDGTTATLTVGAVTVSIANAGVAYSAVTGTATQQGNGDQAMAFKNGNTTGNVLYVNEAAAVNDAKDNQTGYHGIIFDNLFQITTGSNGISNFVEVAGTGTSNAADDLKIMANAATQTIKKGVVANGNVKITDSTQFLIGSIVLGNYVLTPVTGYKNIVDYKPGEVDYVDTNKDGYAEYVYITADPEASTGWHIFYADAQVVSDANGSKAQMRYSKDSYTTTVYGWLDGVADKSVTISNGTAWYADFVNESNGHTLWLVQIVNGYVTDVNGAVADTLGSVTAVNGSTNNAGTYVPNTTYTTAKALSNGTDGMQASLGGTYKDLSIVVVSGNTANAKKSDSIYDITVGGAKQTFSTDDKTVVVDGTMDDIKNANATLIIVYNGNANKNNLISQMYVVNDNVGTSNVKPDTTTYSWTWVTTGSDATKATYASNVVTPHFGLTISPVTTAGTTLKVTATLQVLNAQGTWTDVGSSYVSTTASKGYYREINNGLAISYTCADSNEYRVSFSVEYGGETVATTTVPVVKD